MNKTKKEILEKIRKNEIKMKPKWWFVAKTMGLRSGVGLIWLLGALAASGLWYWWDINNPIELAGVGDVGWEVIKDKLPYWLVVGLGLLLGGGGMLYLKTGENYKKTTRTIVLIVAGAMIGLTILMTWWRYQNELELLLKFS